MAIRYRVVDMRSDPLSDLDVIVEGVRSPEEAVRKAFGIEVVRSGAKPDLVARVYWQMPGDPLNMVRLYARLSKTS